MGSQDLIQRINGVWVLCTCAGLRTARHWNRDNRQGVKDLMGQPEFEINQALHRTRRRWLLSAMINAGGRWAVLPAMLAALAGMMLVLVWQASWPSLAVLALLGFVGIALALALTLRAYARPGVAGSPDYALLLDRSLGLNDALPAYLESTGTFRAALARRIAEGLDPRKEKAAAPQRHFGPLAIALILALLPLALSQIDARPQAPEQTAAAGGESAASNESPAGGKSPPGGPTQAGDKENDEGSEDENKEGSSGKEEEVPGRPDGNKSEEGGGDAPPDRQPTPSPESPQPNSGGAGDEKGQPETPEPPKDPDIKNDFEKVRPEATEGDTAKVDRSRWIYNPDAKPIDESTPAGPDPRGGNERAVDRTKVTTRERKLLNELYRKLFE